MKHVEPWQHNLDALLAEATEAVFGRDHKNTFDAAKRATPSANDDGTSSAPERFLDAPGNLSIHENERATKCEDEGDDIRYGDIPYNGNNDNGNNAAERDADALHNDSGLLIDEVVPGVHGNSSPLGLNLYLNHEIENEIENNEVEHRNASLVPAAVAGVTSHDINWERMGEAAGANRREKPIGHVSNVLIDNINSEGPGSRLAIRAEGAEGKNTRKDARRASGLAWEWRVLLQRGGRSIRDVNGHAARVLGRWTGDRRYNREWGPREYWKAIPLLAFAREWDGRQKVAKIVMEGAWIALALIVGSGAGLLVTRRDGQKGASHGNSHGNTVVQSATTSDRKPAGDPPIVTVATAGNTPDWTDSLSLPPDLLRNNPLVLGPTPMHGHSAAVTPAWSGNPPERHSGGTAASRWMIVRRVAGANVAMYDLKAGSGTDLNSGDTFNVPSLCNTPIQITGGERGRYAGRVTRSMGSWIFALAVNAESCSASAREAAQRTAAGPDVRDAITSTVNSTYRGGRFDGGDLRDIVVATVAGKRLAWGVFRQAIRTTQLVPPPPSHQVAFIAQEDMDGHWRVLWTLTAESSLEALGLAGVYDVNGDGIPEAFFARRAIDGKEYVIELDQNGGIWRQASIEPLN